MPTASVPGGAAAPSATARLSGDRHAPATLCCKWNPVKDQFGTKRVPIWDRSCSSRSTGPRAGRCGPSSRPGCGRRSAPAGCASGTAARFARAGHRPRRLASAGGGRLLAAARRGLSACAPRRWHLRGRGGRAGWCRRRAGPARARLRLLPRLARPRRLPAEGVAARRPRGAAGGARWPSATPTRAVRPSCAARSPVTCAACAASWPTADDRRVLGHGSGARAAGRRCTGGAMAVEDPGLPHLRAILQAHGAALWRFRSTRRATAWSSSAARSASGPGRPGRVLVTPAHQSPSG